MAKGKRGSNKGPNGGMGSSLGAVPGSGPERKRGRWDVAGPGKGPLATEKRVKADASRQRTQGQGDEGDRDDHEREYKALMERTKGKQKAAEFQRQERLRSKLAPGMAPPTFINLPNVPTVNEFVDAMLGDLAAPAAMSTSTQGKADGRRGRAKVSVSRSNNAFAALHMDSGDEDEDEEEEEGLPIFHPATFVPKRGARGMEKRRAVTEGHAESDDEEDEEEQEQEQEQQGHTEEEGQGEAGPAASEGGSFMGPGTFIPPVMFAPATFVPPTAAVQAGTGGQGQDVDDFSDL